MTIKVRCRTNLDDFRLVGVPNKGDHVYSIDGKHRLAVVQVSHKTARDEAEPYAEVELHYDENMATLARLQRERTDAGRP